MSLEYLYRDLARGRTRGLSRLRSGIIVLQPTEFAAFDNVPVLFGQMNFPWFESAKALYTMPQPDDPVNWGALRGLACRS
jgi:hypothetical protein